MDYKKIEAISNGEWVLTEIKKEYGNYLGFHRNLPPGTLCPAFRVDVPPFSLAETEEELLEKLREAERGNVIFGESEIPCYAPDLSLIHI